MRLAAILGVAALSFVGAALAQTDLVPAQAFRAEFTQRPEGHHYAVNYPRQAFSRSTQGVAVLCCRPNADLSLNCAVAYEWPRGAEFGDASLRVSRHFRVTQASHDAFYASPHNWMRQTINWTMNGRSSTEFDRVRQAIAEESQLCRPEAVYASEAPPAPEAAPQP